MSMNSMERATMIARSHGWLVTDDLCLRRLHRTDLPKIVYEKVK
jgi:hypothetical protein